MIVEIDTFDTFLKHLSPGVMIESDSGVLGAYVYLVLDFDVGTDRSRYAIDNREVLVKVYTSRGLVEQRYYDSIHIREENIKIITRN